MDCLRSSKVVRLTKPCPVCLWWFICQITRLSLSESSHCSFPSCLPNLPIESFFTPSLGDCTFSSILFYFTLVLILVRCNIPHHFVMKRTLEQLHKLPMQDEGHARWHPKQSYLRLRVRSSKKRQQQLTCRTYHEDFTFN